MEMIRRAADAAMTEAIRRELAELDRNQGRAREPSPHELRFKPEGNRHSRRKRAAIDRRLEKA